MNPLRRLLRRAAATLAALLLAACGESVDLQSGLNDAEANDVVAALVDGGIGAKKRSTKDGVIVAIAAADLSRANALLHARGLPKRRSALLGDVFKKEGLISSPMEERARYLHALAQELEFTIGQIDGVVVARVHVVLPEKPAPGEPLTASSSAVLVKHTAALDPDLVLPRVRQLVARSVPGLGDKHADKVSLVFLPAPEPPPKPAPPPAEPAASVAAQLAGALAVLAALGGVAYWQRERLGGVLRRRGAQEAAG